jgi:tetratricopeptide (TPR) repeat protein
MTTTADIDRLWNFGDPPGSEAAFKSALESADPLIAQELTTQIARAQGLQDRFAKAFATLDGIAGQVTGRQRVRYLLERGRLLNSSGSPEGSIPLFLAAVNEAEACGEIGLEIDALHMLAIVASEEEQEGWTLAAINRAAGSDDPGVQKWLGSLLHNLGWTYHDAARYQLALDTFEHSLAWHLAHGTPDTIRIARWSIGRALRSCGEIERALNIQESLANQFASETPDGYVFEEIAECLFALGREDEARPYFARAHVALAGDPWLVRKEPERIARLSRMSFDQK